MVRKYIRKSNRGKGYTAESLKAAVSAMKSGQMTLYRTKNVFNIPLATLHDHFKGRRGQKSSSYGSPQDIPQQEEDKLAKDLRLMGGSVADYVKKKQH